MAYRPQLKKLDYYQLSGVGTTLPGTGQDGELFYDTSSNILYIWANNAWNAIGGATPSVNYMLLESGDFFLLENGDKLILG